MLSWLWSPPEGVGKGGRKGGWRQQAAVEAGGEEVYGPSKLGCGLLLAWSDGNMSAAQLHGHSLNAREDGLMHPMINRFASVAPLESPQHSQAGLTRLLQQCGIPSLITRIPHGLITHMVLPSTLTRMIHDHYPAVFQTRFGATPENTKAFWQGFFGRPENAEAIAVHPALSGKTPDDLTYCIPCTLHQDAGPYSKRRSAECISFSSLLGSGSEKTTKFLICNTMKTRRSVPCDVAWPRLLEDWEAMARGEVNGRQIAGVAGGERWSFVLLYLKADEENQANEWGLPHFASNEPCPYCLCNRLTRPFTDLQRTAAWRNNGHLPALVFCERLRTPRHPLLALPQVHAYFSYPDLMHCMDCNGVCSLVYGGILGVLLQDRRLGPNRDARLQHINGMMRVWYAAHPDEHRLPPILMSNVTSDGWCILSGQAIKAAAIRSARGFFQHLCQQYCTSGSRMDALLLAMMNDLSEFYTILYTNGTFLSDEVLQRFQDVCISFGESYQELRGICMDEELLAFPVRPKCHRMQHLPRCARTINPVALQCYAEESLVGTTTKVWKRSMAGRYEHVVQEAVLTKRLTGLLLRMQVGL